MIAKVFRYEMKAYGKLMLLSHAAVVILGLALMLGVGPAQAHAGLGALAAFAVFLFALAVMATVMIVSFMPAIRFYRSVYGDEGYLTNALPLTVNQLLGGKLLAYFAWTTLDFCLLAALMLGVANASVPAAMQEFSAATGVSPLLLGLYILLAVAVVELCTISVTYFVIAVGCLWQEHRLAGIAIAGTVAYILAQIAVLAVFMLGTQHVEAVWELGNTEPGAGIGAVAFVVNLELLTAAAAGLVAYAGTHWLVSKHLNLS